MRRIREILLKQYIGALASGFILAQTAFTAIAIVSQPLTYYFGGRSRARSIFGATESAFPWNSLVGPVINLVLYLLVGYALIYWLYLQPHATGAPASKAEQKDEGQ